MNRISAALAGLSLLLVAACADVAPTTAPMDLDPMLSRDGGGTRQLSYAHRAPHAPPFLGEVVTLEARSGVASSATLYFADGTPFATFSVAAESMTGAALRGTPIGADETVTISIRRVDASRYILDMQPSGLVFNPSAPATVEFFYEHAILPRGAMGVFKQEANGESWGSVHAENHSDRRVMRGRVEDFTRYAMAAPN
jgi:hypothetical protein